MPWPTREMIGQKVPTRWTVADYEDLPDDGIRHEILDGELAMTPAPTTEHQRISRKILVILYQAIELRGQGEVFNAPFDVQLDEATVVQPDVLVLLAEHRDRLTSRRLMGPPDLVVEILSPTTALHDLGTKLRLYARHGIPWYWIIDPDRRQLSEYGLEGETYRLYNIVGEQEDFSPGAFGDLTFRIAEVFTHPVAR